MTLAKIFKPIRWQPSESTEAATPASPGTEPGWQRVGQVGTQPVTNPSSPGPDPARTTQEEGWLAMLEIVFDETGWPDAE